MDSQAFRELASAKTKVNIPIGNVRKLCDLKPAYGHIFEEYLSGYTFWGFCDVDIIWGNIRKFITDDLLANYDIIAALENRIAGHFTLIRNSEIGRMLYQQRDLYKEHFSSPQYRWFDERVLTDIVSDRVRDDEVRVCWNKEAMDTGIESAAHQDYYLDRWLYDSGAVYSLNSTGERVKEYMYLHFLSWKAYIKSDELKDVDRFYISYDNINLSPSGAVAKSLNRIRRAVWGFHRRKSFNLWKRRMKRRWLQQMERWQLIKNRPAD